MNGFTAYEKLSKKRRREIDREKRVTWGAVNPVTKRPERSDVYKRHVEKANTLKLARCRQDDRGGLVLFIKTTRRAS